MTDIAGLITVWAVSAAVFGPLSGALAARHNRNQAVWLVFGALLGPLALALLAAAPPGRCPVCDAPVGGWPERCAACGLRFRGGSVAPLEAPAVDAADGRSSGVATAAPARTGPDQRTGEVIPLPVRSATSRKQAVPTGARVGGRRARPASANGDLGEERLLANAVYFGGNVGLVVGMRYAITRQGDTFRLRGPVDTDPTSVVVEERVADVVATSLSDRLIVSSVEGHRLAIALGAIAGSTGPELELALSVRAADTPARRVGS